MEYLGGAGDLNSATISRILPWNEYENVCEGVGPGHYSRRIVFIGNTWGPLYGEVTFARVRGGVFNDRTHWSKEYGFQRFRVVLDVHWRCRLIVELSRHSLIDLNWELCHPNKKKRL